MSRSKLTSPPDPKIRFSIIHACSNPLSGWHKTFQAWTTNARHPDSIDYILVVDHTQVHDLGVLAPILNRPKERRSLHLPQAVGMFRVMVNKGFPLHAHRFGWGLKEACVGSLKIAVTDLSTVVDHYWDDRLTDSLVRDRQLFLKEEGGAQEGFFIDVAKECESLFYEHTPVEVNP